MNCLVGQVEEKRLRMGPANEAHGPLIEDVGDVTLRLYSLAVLIQLGIGELALSLEADPVVEAGTRRVVQAHVPLADEGRLVARALQQERPGDELVAPGSAL